MAYSSIEVEGALFPPDLRDRIAAGEADGQRLEDFGLPRGGRLSDEVQSAFSDVRAYWEVFQRRLARSKEAATTVTREAWVVPLLERLAFQPKYQGSAAVGGDTFAISHRLLPADDAPPLSVVAAGQDLDRRSEGSRRSPHAALQEYLNRSDHVWGLLTNGEKLRLVRDAVRLSRPTYLEVDLRAIVEANLYSEFVLLYRLLHRSRWPSSIADAPASLLERYYQQGIDEGSRVREHLRDGVEAALREIGTAFVSHPANETLRGSLRQGTLSHAAFYRQLLRLVYRMLFLMVIEERRLIFPPGTDRADAQSVYSRYYSLTALRQRADVPHYGNTHRDLWQGLLRTFELFRDTEKAAQLGLAPMNGELFAHEASQDLEEAECANSALLDAVRQLSTFAPGADAPRRRVNYAGLDVEELGSVYESLLDYHPRVVLNGASQFELVPGSERRQTGSYYTPPDLVKELVHAALVPAIATRLAAAKPGGAEAAILSIRICDPASGSGHFLLEGARRLARELARARAREDDLTPVVYRSALRDVIRTCIYAVDKNPLAVDLCKVALWIEGHSAGLPLSFLDHHVKHGDSLLGVGPELDLEEGIPSGAYQRSDPAQRARVRSLRHQNEVERSGQLTLTVELHSDLSGLAMSFGSITDLPDDSASSVAEKHRRYVAAREQGGTWWMEATAANLWAGAFFADVRGSVPTTGSLRSFRADPDRRSQDRLVAEAWSLANAPEHPFFHWPLEFPEVFAAGGFDVVLSNPPFMGGLRIRGNFGEAYRNYLSVTFLPFAGRADLCAAFLRRALSIVRPDGRVGMVVTKTIGEGDTREAGLGLLVRNGASIAFARRFIKWPGTANVEVNLVAVQRGLQPGRRFLDGRAVSSISSRLDDRDEDEPKQLEQNRGSAFQGSNIVGMGFTLPPEQARQLIARNARNADCLFPFLNGADFNSRPDQSASRWVIQFDERSEEEARSYPDLWRMVEESVRPERLKLDPTMYRRAVSEWWKHVVNPQELYRRVRALNRVLVRARTSDHHVLAFVPTNQIFSEAVHVFAFDDGYHFALLQSNIHEAWVRRYATRLRTDVRYTLSGCFETFPFPQEAGGRAHAACAEAGEAYHEYRAALMRRLGIGLTNTTNMLDDPDRHDDDLVQLRELHKVMDRAALECYGWREIELDHGFHADARGDTRFTISAAARVRLLVGLLDLNTRQALATPSEQGLPQGVSA